MPHPLMIRARATQNLADEPPAGLTEAMIEQLVREFYRRARQDAVLGPIFEVRLADHWEEHIGRLVDFWSQIGLRTGRYDGRPLPAHAAMGLEPDHFVRWLGLFEATARDVTPPDAAAFFIGRAHRIAESFQLGLNIGDKALAFRTAQKAREE